MKQTMLLPMPRLPMKLLAPVTQPTAISFYTGFLCNKHVRDSKLISTNAAEPVWSDIDGQYYVQYENNGITYKIWVEDAASLEEKLKVLQENQLAGGSFWKLGLELPSIWDTIIKYIN